MVSGEEFNKMIDMATSAQKRSRHFFNYCDYFFLTVLKNVLGHSL
jgi:hypothetical protein